MTYWILFLSIPMIIACARGHKYAMSIASVTVFMCLIPVFGVFLWIPLLIIATWPKQEKNTDGNRTVHQEIRQHDGWRRD